MPATLDDHEGILEMHEEYMQGKTLRELGAAHGISYERVRQLFEAEGLPTERPKRQTLKRYASEVSAWHQKDKIWECYRDRGTIEAVADELGLPRPQVAQVVNEMPLRQIYRRKGETRAYDRDRIISVLRQAAKVCGEPLTIPNYRSQAPAHKWPTDLTVIRAFGTWEKACEAAGVKANPSQGPRKGAYTAEDCIIAVRLCSADIGSVPSYERYVKWARANRQPSGATVRVKVGPWREALKQAFG